MSKGTDLASAYRVGLVIVLAVAASSCGNAGSAEEAPSSIEPKVPCLGDEAATLFDEGYILTDNAEISKLEDLSARYGAMPGVRAVVASPMGVTYVVVDDDASEALTQEAQADSLSMVRSCISSADLRAAQAIKLDLGPGDYLSVGYHVYNDEIQISTSRPENEVRSALAKAAVTGRVAVAVGNPGVTRRGGE